MDYENKVSDLKFLLQKAERDMQYKDEEIKHFKKIARDLAE